MLYILKKKTIFAYAGRMVVDKIVSWRRWWSKGSSNYMTTGLSYPYGSHFLWKRWWIETKQVPILVSQFRKYPLYWHDLRHAYSKKRSHQKDTTSNSCHIQLLCWYALMMDVFLLVSGLGMRRPSQRLEGQGFNKLDMIFGRTLFVSLEELIGSQFSDDLVEAMSIIHTVAGGVSSLLVVLPVGFVLNI